MLTPYLKAERKTFTRLVRDRSGALLRISFEVYSSAGALKGRIVSVERVIELATVPVSHSCNLLSVTCSKNEIAADFTLSSTLIASPYFSLEFLINSQPTRAPAYN